MVEDLGRKDVRGYTETGDFREDWCRKLGLTLDCSAEDFLPVSYTHLDVYKRQ